MKLNLKGFIIMALASVSIEVLVTSCIRAEKDNINLDITDVKSADLEAALNGDGIVKTTIQENGVTLYADMSKCDPKHLNLDVTVSPDAKWNYVKVKMDTTFYIYQDASGNTIKIYRHDIEGCKIDTTVVGDIEDPNDFTKTQYIKVVCAAEGVEEEDKFTQYMIDRNQSGFIGWDNNGVLSKSYSPGAHLYKIWSIDLLPAGIPTTLTFDNWSDITGTEYQLPYELADGNKSNIWSSTNASIALMAKTNKLVTYGAAATTDVAPVRGTENKSALLLTSNDIRYTQTVTRPFLAGCCFIGEFDGSDTGALTCTHVGLPFNQLPDKLCFWYKYLPMKIENPNDNIFGYSFNVPGIENYIGKEDKGFIRAVLYRADGENQWLDGETIRDPENDNVIAYAEFAPEGTVDTYKQQEVSFTYVKDVNQDDLKNWKYNLAIYFASSYDGFRFICGANMNQAMVDLQKYQAMLKAGQMSQIEFYQKYQEILATQKGTKLFIDEMEIKCK